MNQAEELFAIGRELGSRAPVARAVPGAAVVAVRARFENAPPPLEWLRALELGLAQLAITMKQPSLRARFELLPNTIVTAAAVERPGLHVVDPAYELCATPDRAVTLETNGAITPREALREAARAISARRPATNAR